MSDENEDEQLARDEEQALSRALLAAVRPEPLSAAQHEAILERAGLVAADAPPTQEEARAAAALARALDESADADSDELRLARELKLAVSGTADADGVRAHERALARSGALRSARGKLLVVSFGVGSAALAAAAAVTVFVGSTGQERVAGLVPTRSVAPLFARSGNELGASARLDRIAAERRRDLRANRYATWGVR